MQGCAQKQSKFVLKTNTYCLMAVPIKSQFLICSLARLPRHEGGGGGGGGGGGEGVLDIPSQFVNCCVVLWCTSQTWIIPVSV